MNKLFEFICQLKMICFFPFSSLQKSSYTNIPQNLSLAFILYSYILQTKCLRSLERQSLYT
jgi:hypothetical protein